MCCGDSEAAKISPGHGPPKTVRTRQCMERVLPPMPVVRYPSLRRLPQCLLPFLSLHRP